MYTITHIIYLHCFLYSKEERTDRRAHAGNVMDIARIANQGYNGRRSTKRSDGRSDRSYAAKRSKFSDEFMSGKYQMKRRVREKEDFYGRGRMSQRSERGVSQRSYGTSSMDSPIEKYQDMKRLGYQFEDGEKIPAKMPEYISTPSPTPLPRSSDKYSCHQDTGSEVTEEKSKDLL